MPSTLLLIDVQQGFDEPMWGTRNNLHAEANIARLLVEWRRLSRPIIHIQHVSVMPNSPLRPHQNGVEFKLEAQPLSGEPIFQKHVNSAFIGTDLESTLRRENVTELVIVGLTTDHCVSTTTRMAANLGFQVQVVADATATFERTSYDGKHYSAQDMHDSALTSLHGEFATIVQTQDLIRT